ncbi:MAG TPA: hypothetical protein VMY42_09550 [Thermoguttaceae bacterium]|nr:hypothetical protein [Thermoguttaceae bacterium]
MDILPASRQQVDQQPDHGAIVARVSGLARDDLWRVDEDRTLSHPAKRVYRVLHRTAAAIGSAELAVTAAAVAERIGATDPRTARRALDELAGQDLISLVDRDRRRGTLLVVVYAPYPGKAAPLPDPQKRFEFDRADNPAQACPPDGQECKVTDKLAQACPPKSDDAPGGMPGSAHAGAGARVGSDARGSLLLSSLFSSRSEEKEKETDWTTTVECYRRARERMVGPKGNIGQGLARLLLQAARLAVTDLGTSWLMEAVGVAARKKATDPATYLQAILSNLAWERAHGHQPEDDAEKSRARVSFRQQLASVSATMPPDAEITRLLNESIGDRRT